jgi:hypothetical protein
MTDLMARWSARGVLAVALLAGAIGVGSAADRPRPPSGSGVAPTPYVVVPWGFGYLPWPAAGEAGPPAGPGEPGAPGGPAVPAAPLGSRWNGRFLAPLTRDDSRYEVVPPGASRERPAPGGGYYVVPRP